MIRFEQVSKYYGACRANDGLNLSVAQGTIHAIIGENGAGKSTAMRLLFGMELPTSGNIFIKDKKTHYRSSRDAMADGIGMVHQHFMLSPVHSALDNVLLGGTQDIGIARFIPRPFRPLPRKRALKTLEELSKSVDFRIPWNTPVQELPVGIQQQVEIVKLLFKGVDIMIFDEPTAVLSPQETDQFIAMLGRLKAQGKTIIIITHKLGEVKAVSDDVTIMRKGTTVGTRKTSEVSVQELADLMVGRHVLLHAKEQSPPRLGSTVLSLKHVTLRKSHKPLLQDINLEVRAGEIVGIAGVEGNGQSDLLHMLYDPRSRRRGRYDREGEIYFGAENAVNWTAKEVRARNVGVVAADRHRESVLLEDSLTENNLLGYLKEFSSHGIIQRKKLLKATLDLINEFDVRPNDPQATMGSLSGGNQQKFVMARELLRNPSLLLCAQPTRGVDVGSIEHIHRELLAARTAGMGVLLVSSQLDELMQLSDRLIVMCSGKIVATFDRQLQKFDERLIGMAMGGEGQHS